MRKFRIVGGCGRRELAAAGALAPRPVRRPERVAVWVRQRRTGRLEMRWQVVRSGDAGLLEVPLWAA